MTTIIFPSCPKEIQDEIVEYKKDKLVGNSILKKVQFDFKKINIVHQNLKFLISENEKQSDITSKLKQAILQEAIAGQLTAEWRDRNPMQKGNPDTDAAALLAKIKAEKQQLIADGKLKKEKPLPEISPDEIPFSLPDSWVWCRLGEIVKYISDGAHFTPDYIPYGIPFLSVKDISHGFIDFSNCRYISEIEHQQLTQRCNPEFDDVLLTKVGTTGIAKVVDTKREFSIFVSVALLKMFSNYLFPKYLEYCINSPFVKKQSFDGTWGVGNKNLVLKTIKIFSIPLPPLAEQQAIVEKVDYLMKIIDQLEEQIKHRKKLAEDLMQTVLREAFE